MPKLPAADKLTDRTTFLLGGGMSYQAATPRLTPRARLPARPHSVAPPPPPLSY